MLDIECKLLQTIRSDKNWGTQIGEPYESTIVYKIFATLIILAGVYTCHKHIVLFL